MSGILQSVKHVLTNLPRPSLNRVTLIGTVGMDPKIHTMGESTRKTTFSLATSSSYKNREGSCIKHTEWHTIGTYNEFLGQYVTKNVKKGCQVYVEGSIFSRAYQDANGVQKKFSEIIVSKGLIKVLMPSTRVEQEPQASEAEANEQTESIPTPEYEAVNIPPQKPRKGTQREDEYVF